MCTLLILRRPGHPWPVLVAANRDELTARPALPPARHWPEWPEVVGGLDCLGGGSWLGVNDHGLLAAVLNRDGTLGPADGKRSRGELVLEALDYAEAGAAAGALADLSPDAYRPFNLLVADPRAAYWLRHGGDGEVRVHPIPTGLHMLAGTELDDLDHPRIRAYLPRFRAASVPMPEPDQAGPPELGWADWLRLLRERGNDPTADPRGAMNQSVVVPAGNFATVASSLIAVPAFPGFAAPMLWWHAQGAPDQTEFARVDL